MGHGHAHHHGDADELPAGIAAVLALPDRRAGDAWDRMVLADGVKQQLLNWAILALRHGAALSGDAGLQRLLLLAGPPGTGKSTTARGLAHAAISEIDAGLGGLLVEIDSHAMPSDMLGQSQRNITKLMHHTIPALARERQQPIVVIIDEVDAFAVSRSAASFETNPADLHRATDAVLAGLDLVAREYPSVLLVATTNFPAAVDDAVLSRADWTLRFDNPDAAATAEILRGTLQRLGEHWDAIAVLAADDEALQRLAERVVGIDGRSIAKLPAMALTLRREVAVAPHRLTFDDLAWAADQLVDVREPRQTPR